MKRRSLLLSGLSILGNSSLVSFALAAKPARTGVTLQLITANAPVLFLHSSEVYFPEDPLAFIKASRFRHHKGFGPDQGWNKEKNRFETTNSRAEKYYNIPLKVINRYGLHANGKNRRPRDANSGNDTNVFLQPEGARKGNRNLPDVPVFYRIRNVAGRSEFDAVVQYWYFFGYNQTPVSFGALGSFAHQGDWEHIDIAFKNQKPVLVFFFAHGGGKKFKHQNLRKNTAGQVIAFCAKGTHGIYSEKGKHSVSGIFEDLTDSGFEWNGSKKLLNLKSQGWRNFAGAWGEVGSPLIGSPFPWGADTTGPLGPYVKPIPDWK